MNAATTTPTPPAPRFEAARLADGWTVVDRQCEAAIELGRPWDEAMAAVVADALNARPAYAVQFRWSEPGSYPPGGGPGGELPLPTLLRGSPW